MNEYQPGVEIENVETYPMTRERKLIQIDCRVTTCRFYRKRGACANPAPAITFYTTDDYMCWSREIKKND